MEECENTYASTSAEVSNGALKRFPSPIEFLTYDSAPFFINRIRMHKTDNLPSFKFPKILWSFHEKEIGDMTQILTQNVPWNASIPRPTDHCPLPP